MKKDEHLKLNGTNVEDKSKTATDPRRKQTDKLQDIDSVSKATIITYILS
ncbi:MAG: hypothetical protein PF505_12790 [Vallitaleaceae bacterium]|nr:hypothetical protein [Vallitaleaceae bacterium]